MLGHYRGRRPSAFAAGLLTVPAGYFTIGTNGARILFMLWLLSAVTMLLGPALLTYLAALKLGPDALARGTELDARCDLFQIHVASSGKRHNAAALDEARNGQ